MPYRQTNNNHIDNSKELISEQLQPKSPTLTRSVSRHQLVLATRSPCGRMGFATVMVKGDESKAGFGVWFGPDDPRNNYGPLPESSLHTNQRAELFAVKRALELTASDSRPLVIKSDSRYTIDCFDKWLPQWRSNGFQTAGKTPVKNRDLIEGIDRLMRTRKPGLIQFEHVRGLVKTAVSGMVDSVLLVVAHGKSVGNKQADKLAAMGKSMAACRPCNR